MLLSEIPRSVKRSRPSTTCASPMRPTVRAFTRLWSAPSSIDDALALLLLVEAFDDELLQQCLVAGVAALCEPLQPLDREFVETYGNRGRPSPRPRWPCSVSTSLSLVGLG